MSGRVNWVSSVHLNGTEGMLVLMCLYWYVCIDVFVLTCLY